MKKLLFVILLALALCLSACSFAANDPTETGTVATEATAAQTEATGNTESSQPEADTISQLPLPEETTKFAFSSGAGAWSSVISLKQDGSFTGNYSDWEAGMYYVCDFSGKFTDFEKVNDYTYKMTLVDLKSEKEAGVEWTENEFLHIASVPQGLVDQLNDRECKEFILYLPDAPVAQLNADFVSWSPYQNTYEGKPNATLSCYGIRNVTTNDGFFYGTANN